MIGWHEGAGHQGSVDHEYNYLQGQYCVNF